MPKSFRVVIQWFSSFLVFYLFLGFFAFPVHAQTAPTHENDITSFSPNIESNVPRNQHTLAQSVLIEVLSAVQCVIIGIDPMNPSQPCLDINPITGQLGYAPSATNGSEKSVVGGLLGVGTGLIGALYIPTTSSSEYIRYLADNFGVVKTTYAAPASGFDGLQPIIKLWIATRNIAYFLLIIAFVFIGIGVMLRIRIDPRTVMTIQNQIPRVIIAILLITFSYAIGAIMIDLMWTMTYVGINQISTANNATIPCFGGQSTVNAQATQGIYQTPLAYVNAVYANRCQDSGIAGITIKVSNAIGSLIANLMNDFFNPPGTGQCVGWTGIDVNDCLQKGISLIVGYITRIILSLIIFIAIIISLFRTWFELLKAYIYIFIYIITAPVWIVFGLFPGRPLGFEKWIRGYFVNLAFFPLVAWLYVGGRVITDLFEQNPQDKFIPPLVGNPATGAFSGLIAFGVLMIAPTILSLLRDKMKVPGIKQGAAIGAGLAAGAAVVGAPASKTWSHLNRRNPQTGAPEGFLAKKRSEIGTGILEKLSNVKGLGGLKSTIEKRKHVESGQPLSTYRPGQAQAQKDVQFREAQQNAPQIYGQHVAPLKPGEVATPEYLKAKAKSDAGRKKWDIDQQIDELKMKQSAVGKWRASRAQKKIDKLTQERAKYGPDEQAEQPNPPPVVRPTGRQLLQGGQTEGEGTSGREEGKKTEDGGKGLIEGGAINVQHADLVEGAGDVHVAGGGAAPGATALPEKQINLPGATEEEVEENPDDTEPKKTS